jgi:hypothetical protein
MHLHAHLIHFIVDTKEHLEHCLTKLTAAQSNETLDWIANLNFTEEERASPEATKSPPTQGSRVVYDEAAPDHLSASFN